MSALLQYQSGVPIYTIMLKYGITEETLFAWYRQYQNMSFDQLRRVCLMEAEIVALQMLVDSIARDDDHQVNEGALGSTADVVLSA